MGDGITPLQSAFDMTGAKRFIQLDVSYSRSELEVRRERWNSIERGRSQRTKPKQSKAKQNKAKQSKAKQIKAKQGSLDSQDQSQAKWCGWRH